MFVTERSTKLVSRLHIPLHWVQVAEGHQLRSTCFFLRALDPAWPLGCATCISWTQNKLGQLTVPKKTADSIHLVRAIMSLVHPCRYLKVQQQVLV